MVSWDDVGCSSRMIKLTRVSRVSWTVSDADILGRRACISKSFSKDLICAELYRKVRC